MNDWDGAVALRIHLGQATWLVAGRHEEDISSSDDLVLPLRGESNVPDHLPFVLSLRSSQEVCVSLLSTSHHHQLNVSCDALGVPGDEPWEDLLDQIHALLRRKTPDEAHEGNVLSHLQPQLSLQQLLRLRLARRVSRREADPLGNQELVLAGVPLVHVDAVENSHRVREAEACHLVHPPGSFEGHDLVAVGGSHSADLVRHLDPSLQQLDRFSLVQGMRSLLLRIHPEVLVVIRVVSQSKVAEGERWSFGVGRVGERPLVAHVVYVEDASRLGVDLVSPVVARQDQGHEACLPVIGEEDNVLSVGNSSARHDERRLKRCPGKQSESEQVVSIVHATFSVHSLALERPMLHKHVVYTLVLADQLVLVTVLHRMSCVPQPKRSFHPRRLNTFILTIHGSDCHHTMSKLRQRYTQLIRHIS
mmetsp:Transcript_28839/g.65345  ORF Transcript_28839/g.65345 Transcript_28839/m.65345 type:complete len:419 (+) Transcript_28839:549-1805(+)